VNNLTFGDKLRGLREEKGLSLRELASSIGISAAFLSDVELGRRFPSADKLDLLARKLGVKAEELRKYDFRDEAEKIRRMMFANPAAGLAFRTVAEKMKGGASPDQIVKRLKNFPRR
jgi:transcriptional regulator with XRE-family HTH domain